MAQQKSKMVVGFNHNVKHHGKVYHVQTEDSGSDNPHIITHLFVGGNILATKKTSYADIVQADNLEQIVRELMEEQHKAMLRNLINGVYDELDRSMSKPPTMDTASLGSPEIPVPAPAPPSTVPAPVSAPAAPAAPLAPTAPPSALPEPSLSPPAASPPAPVATTAPAADFKKKFPLPVSAPTSPPISAGSPPPLKIVAPAAHTTPGARPQAHAETPHPAPKRKLQAQVARPGTAADSKPPTRKKLPPEVVAARRMVDRPVPKEAAGPTIFGEDLISEKSLDEVILGYLSGDGDEGS